MLDERSLDALHHNDRREEVGRRQGLEREVDGLEDRKQPARNHVGREQEASRRDFTKTTALEELDQLVGPVVVVVDMRRLPEDLLGAAEPRAVSVWKVDDRGATGFKTRYTSWSAVSMSGMYRKAEKLTTPANWPLWNGIFLASPT